MKLLAYIIIIMTMIFTSDKDIYNFTVESIDGGSINFSAFKGKKILIVNTASQCGYTPQYAQLEKLYVTYANKLVIVAFPANDFGAQEPDNNANIKKFCQKNYGVTFPIAAKTIVVGNKAHPIFKFLTAEAKKIGSNDPIKWNFTKFLLDEKGQLIKVFPSSVSPTDDAITAIL